MITAFLPCRAGSERISRKNTRPFAGYEGGLTAIKLEQLAACPEIDRIVLSTDDEEVISIARSLSEIGTKLAIDKRPQELCQSSTSTDDLIRYVPSVIPVGTVLWTHVTSPLVQPARYSEIAKAYRSALENGTHDSLMTVTPIREFLWTERGAWNYDREREKWPRTQTLRPVYAVNNAAFVLEAQLMAETLDRIGESPFLFELDAVESTDIDWPEQFDLAEVLFMRHLGT